MGKTYLKTSHRQSSSFCLGNYTNEELINSSTGKFVRFCDCAIYLKSFRHHLPFYYLYIVLTLKAYRENIRSLSSPDTLPLISSPSQMHAGRSTLWLTSLLLHPTVPSRFYNSWGCCFYYQFSSTPVITRQRGMGSFYLGAMEHGKGQRSGVWKIQQNPRSNDGTCHSACTPKVLLEYRAFYFFFPFPF